MIFFIYLNYPIPTVIPYRRRYIPRAIDPPFLRVLKPFPRGQYVPYLHIPPSVNNPSARNLSYCSRFHHPTQGGCARNLFPQNDRPYLSRHTLSFSSAYTSNTKTAIVSHPPPHIVCTHIVQSFGSCLIIRPFLSRVREIP